MKKALFLSLTLSLSPAAFAKERPQENNPIDPKKYLLEQQMQAGPEKKASTKTTIGYVNGVRSLRVEIEGGGAIIIPYRSHLDEETIRAEGKCVETPQDTKFEATAGEVRGEIVKEVEMFAGLIAQQAKKYCHNMDGSGTNKPQVNPHLDIGVSFPNDGRKSGGTKIFNRDLGPNIYFQKDF